MSARPPHDVRKVNRAAVLLLGLIFATVGVAHAQTGSPLRPPPGMSFVAQDTSGAWGLYRIDPTGTAVRLPTEQEPRQACVAPDGSKAVYAAADGTIRLLAAGSPQETVLARADVRRSYTQPCMAADGSAVYVVEMADGKSIDTEILRFDKAPEPSHIARQPGAQQDPFVYQGRWFVYASVGCSAGCDELLVEIWGRDLLTGKARQLTLLNALSQAPVTDGRRVLFSSNAGGIHQVWQVGIDGSGTHGVTHGPAQHVSPAICEGAVYAVQESAAGSAIVRVNDGGASVALPLPGLRSFRALRCL